MALVDPKTGAALTTYADWAAAGKPNSGHINPGTDAFQTIVKKSTKIGKGYTVSAQTKAINDLIASATKTAQDNKDKAAKRQADDENAAAKAANAATEKATASSLKAFGGTEPSSFTTPTSRVTKPPPGYDPGKVSALEDQLSKDYQKQNAVPSKSKSLWDDLTSGDVGGLAGDALSNVVENTVDRPLNVLAHGLDYAGRGGNAVNNAVDALINNVKSGVMGAAQTAAAGKNPINTAPLNPESYRLTTAPTQATTDIGQALEKGITGEQRTSGAQIIKDLGINVPVVTPLLGFGTDVALDPTTYLDLGVGKAIKSAVKGTGIEAAIDIEKQALKAGAKAATFETATQAGLKAANRKSLEVVQRLAASGGALGGKVAKVDAVGKSAYDGTIKAGGSIPDALAAAREAVHSSELADAGVQKMQTRAAQLARENAGAITVRVGGKEVPITKAVGKPIYNVTHKIVSKATNNAIGEEIAKRFSTNYWLPGATHDIYNRVKNTGVHEAQAFLKDVNSTFKGVTKSEKQRITTAIESGEDLHGALSKNGKDLGNLQDYYRNASDKMFGEDKNLLGKYDDTQYAKNYVYHYYNSPNTRHMNTVLKDFKGVRKARLLAGDNAGVTIKDAADKGLKPLKEIDKVLTAQYAHHSTALVRDAFDRKIFDTYGVVSDNALFAQRAGLKPVTKLPKGMALKKGMNMYLPDSVNQVRGGISEFMRGGNNDGHSQLLQHLDSIIHKWKFLNTAANPGHHINNMLGDAFLNYIDGVRDPRLYGQAIHLLSGQGLENMKIKIGQQVIDGHTLMDMWKKSGAESGFFATELHGGKFPLENKIYAASEKREEMGRLAHYIHAIKDEGAKVNLGANNKVGLTRASYDAAKRVNKWNINYADLTPFERSTMKRVMPFYTWMRKSTPLMVEALATRPGRMTMTNKLQRLVENLAGQEPTDQQSDTPFPQWMNDSGFARLTGGDQPTVWTDPLPSASQLGGLFGGGPKGLGKNLLGGINPIAQVALEQITGKNLLTGASTPTDIGSYAPSQIGFLNTVLAATGQGKYSDPVERLNKLSGLKIYKDTTNRQLGAVHAKIDTLTPSLKQLSTDLGNYEIHKVKGGYVIYSKSLKKQVGQTASTEAELIPTALAMAKKDKSGGP